MKYYPPIPVILTIASTTKMPVMKIFTFSKTSKSYYEIPSHFRHRMKTLKMILPYMNGSNFGC